MIENDTGYIFARYHVDREAVPKSERNKLAQIAQSELFQYVCSLLAGPYDVTVTDIGLDGCVTAPETVTQTLAKRWSKIRLGKDTWHKLKGWEALFTEFIGQRIYKCSRQFLVPSILEDATNTGFVIYKIKKHFIWATHNCNGDRKKLRQLFLGASDYYGAKYGWHEIEIEIFREFIDKLLGDDEEAEKFAHGTFTSLCESFHSTANHFCPKGSSRGFDAYNMLKDIAIISWNEKNMIRNGHMDGVRGQYLEAVLTELLLLGADLEDLILADLS
jgi:hypothetical protein